ncbi:MAG TPA: glycosyltransferase, partial [Anaerolineales bacterium]|nr:glycosyltransferase [Anaerolineales bacterium]
MAKLSLSMIVKNEARDLARCLESVKPVVSEIVVVDTGSTDETPQIAAGLGARVISTPWTNDFSAARNIGLDAATGDWLLLLDADEELPAETAAQIPDLLARAEASDPQIDGYLVICRSPMPPGEPVAFTDHPTLRLLRNRPNYRFRQPIHEQLLPSLYESGARVEATSLKIMHYGYARTTVQGGRPRAERDREVLEVALRRDPDNIDLLFQLGALAQREGRDAEARDVLRRVVAADEHLGPVERALAHFFLSNLEMQAGDAAQALQHAEASIRASTHSSATMARLQAAAAHLRLGQLAIQSASQALKSAATDARRDDAAAQLEAGRRHFSAAHEAFGA